jgi:hypothetical protein
VIVSCCDSSFDDIKSGEKSCDGGKRIHAGALGVARCVGATDSMSHGNRKGERA